MSNLRDALKEWDSLDMDELMEPEATIVLAARLVANPNIEAAREAVDMPAVVLLLWRIMELMGVATADFPERDVTGFALMIRDSIVNNETIAAALTPGDTE
jgi:hypothetical protein